MMSRIVVLALAPSLLAFSNPHSRHLDPPTPAWVYVASAGSVLVMGSIWFIKTMKKSTAVDGPQALKQRVTPAVAYFGNSAERKAFKQIHTAEELQRFAAEFWSKRDPDSTTPGNEAKDAYEQRRKYANESFREGRRAGWETARGRVYLLYGPPDEILHEHWIDLPLPGASIKSLEFWFYYRPASAGEPPNLFARMNAGMVKFVFADVEGVGPQTQIYSSEPGEQKDSRMLLGATPAESERRK
ncbi:GWxTD domain-containing protein [candidate division KSB1 bacterium]|nr:GWxTD domain-containing protein [bacterium]NUM64181.1 GWxTD domain-containing protein [candidate division KSB1 bacterium]